MPNVIVPQGIKFLNKIGSFVFKDNARNEVMFVGEYNASYAVNITTSAQDTRGGAGNALLMRTYSDRTLEVNMVARDWNLEYVAASVGSKLEYGLRDIFVMAAPTDIDANGIGVLTQVPTTNVYIKLENGASFSVTPIPPVAPATEYTIDLSPFEVADACVKVTYQYETNATSVMITASGTPFIGNLVLTGEVTSSLLGVIGEVQVNIPSFALDGNITLSMNADGTATETTLNGVALAVDGHACGDGMVYGYVNEISYAGVSPTLVDIVASPSPIELLLTPTPEIAMISVIGSRGIMFSDVGITNDQCTFVSSEPTIATVDASGLVTAVAVGSVVITVTHTESNLSDEVDVEVID